MSAGAFKNCLAYFNCTNLHKQKVSDASLKPRSTKSDARAHFLTALGHVPKAANLQRLLDVEILGLEPEGGYETTDDRSPSLIDRGRLAQYALHCNVPPNRRPLIWAILLGLSFVYSK